MGRRSGRAGFWPWMLTAPLLFMDLPHDKFTGCVAKGGVLALATVRSGRPSLTVKAHYSTNCVLIDLGPTQLLPTRLHCRHLWSGTGIIPVGRAARSGRGLEWVVEGGGGGVMKGRG